MSQSVDQLELPRPGSMTKSGASLEGAYSPEGFEEAFGELPGRVIVSLVFVIHGSPLLDRLIISITNYIEAKNRSQGTVQ
jgi:hypothetical protein